jgi:outer membrane immunogenic protein
MRMMRRICVAAVGAWALAAPAGPACAADIAAGYRQPYLGPPPPPPPPPVVVALGPSWTGFYLGVNAGGAWGRSQWDGIGGSDLYGGLIGGTVGFNWQLASPVVVGVEGDIDWSGVSASSSLCSGCETRNHWLATVRGRAGIAFGTGSFLPYVTGGLALGDIQATAPGFPGGSATTAGWTLGGGLEYMFFASRVSVKAEYLHVDLGDFNCGLNCGLTPSGNVAFHANLFRLGLNVRLP